MERRRERRLVTNLLLRAWGMGSDGHTFFQDVQAHNISSRGAKIWGIEHPIRPGDVIGLQLPGHGKARFRVAWIMGTDLLKFQAGLLIRMWGMGTDVGKPRNNHKVERMSSV